MKALDKLRRFSGRLRNESIASEMKANELDDIADEIEAELADGWMEVPVDKDGAPIHVGDELCGYGLPDGGVVAKALNGTMVIVGRLEGCENYAKNGMLWYARETRHVKPNRLKELLESYYDTRRELLSHGSTAEETDGFTDQYAEKIRELLKEGE